MKALIYQPQPTPSQSGTAKFEKWLLEFEAEERPGNYPLMGWISSADMKQELKMAFSTREDAVSFAKKHDIPYEVIEPLPRKRVIRAYADNFK